MRQLRVTPRWAISIAALVVVGSLTAAWFLLRDDDASRTAALAARLPDVVGKPPTVAWPRRVRCRVEETAVCAPEGTGGGEVLYLYEMINLDRASPGLIGLLGLFLEDGFEAVIACPPAVSEGTARCAVGRVGPDTMDVPPESAVYVR
ncbi:MAG: hypothetical protein WCE47_04085 [Gaiella sp.]|uniref:hypothetical protein n=1 Tax=Gaiella sp. TaxID=2663207 RepID=UPI002C48134B|nr:hypothetical protein [Gaiella sp.]